MDSTGHPPSRGILVIVMIGIAIGLVSELVKFVAALRRIGEEQHDYPHGART